MDTPQLWDAINEMNKQGVVIGSLLGGFTLAAAFQGFSQNWSGRVHKYSAIAAFVASISFVCVVFISALVVFSFADYEYQYSLKRMQESAPMYFLNLTMINFVLGFIGTLALFIMFGLLGWMRGVGLGIFTTAITLVGILALSVSLYSACKNVVPNYGNLPVISNVCMKKPEAEKS